MCVFAAQIFVWGKPVSAVRSCTQALLRRNGVCVSNIGSCVVSPHRYRTWLEQNSNIQDFYFIFFITEHCAVRSSFFNLKIMACKPGFESHLGYLIFSYFLVNPFSYLGLFLVSSFPLFSLPYCSLAQLLIVPTCSLFHVQLLSLISPQVSLSLFSPPQYI